MSIVENRRVVVTGKVANESRQTAQAKLREAGAIVQDAVSKDTDFLICGDRVGPAKVNKARALNVEILAWNDVWNGRTSGSPKAPPPPRAPMPTVRQWAPQLCKAEELPAGGKWSYEIKWDGQRGVATIEDGQVYLQSRSGKTDLTGRYPEIAEELAGFPNCVLDGEICVLDNQLGLLPEDCDPDPVARFVVFDLLVEGDQETVARPLSQRREILHTIVSASGGCYVAPSPVFDDGEKLIAFVIEHGMEGIVSKLTDSKYTEGSRGPAWLKTKVRKEDEFIALGFTAGEGSREWAFGALILGYHEGGRIQYAGRVGTGFDDDCLRMLMTKMEPLIWDRPAGSCPWEGELPKELLHEATWLAQPGIVVQVAYQKFTDDLRLWHPSFIRLRDDKEPEDVVFPG